MTLADVLANPSIVSKLSSNEIQALRFECYNVGDALASAYVQAASRELNAQTFPKQFIGGLMDAAEVARLLNLTKPAVYALMRTGEIPTVTIGKFKKAPVGGVAEYLSKRLREGEADRPRRKR